MELFSGKRNPNDNDEPIVSSQEEDGVIFWERNPNDSDEPIVSSQLTEAQRKEMLALLKEFRTTLSNRPGKTAIVEHTVDTGTSKPIRLRPYRLPTAYRDVVRTELKEMLECEVIEPSASEWAAPIVLVQKKDGGVRLCVDYRKLNNVSTMDAYPMPRIDDLIDRVG